MDALVDGSHYLWRPRECCPGLGSSIIAVCDPSTELWSLLPTTGPLPPGEWGGRSVCVGRCLYTFGGHDGSSYFNDMSKLDLDTLKWTTIQFSGSQPMKKAFCGLVRVNKRTLCCFGGQGIKGTSQPGSTFIKTGRSDGSGWTNEFHFFDTQNGVWSSPELRGERPPPCSGFTFTMVDQHRAVLFGGNQPDRVVVNEVYMFDFRTMEVSKVKPVHGEPWPVGRSHHAACCLNYGQDHPQLLMYGGLDNDGKTLGDMWILNVDTGKWTEVTPPESMTPRHYHSITATSLGPGLTEVLVFGGLQKNYTTVAKTTILRFELTGPSASSAGPSAGKWALVNVAHNHTRGSAQRLREKRLKQATARASSVSETSDHSFQDRVRALEQQLRAAERREHNTQRRHQLQLQEKDLELATQARELTEANRRHGDAEERTQLAEQREQATQLLLQEKNRELATQASELVTKNHELAEANRHHGDALRKVQQIAQEELAIKDRELAEANRREADQITALERELEGKTKELAAHNTEVWRIPAHRVIIGRRIGKGGWGEVLEGTVSVAVKRLHEEIAYPIHVDKMVKEMKLLAEVRHPNLVQFIGAVFDEQDNESPPTLITELLDMNLRQAYERNQLDPGNRLSVFMDIALALNYLHQRYDPIIHRDVSAPNVLLQRMPNHQWKGKVSDLGSANFLQHAHTMGEGAIIYSPPEVMPQAADPFNPPPRQSVKIDVYSYGIVLCEVIASRFPSAEHYRDMILQVQREQPVMCELIVRCTKREPSHRPSMAQVMVELNKIAPF
ncbi:uncharacterized protein LOC135340943 isoform X2 [Halichondria panicea]